jgi:hypothetical protein
MNDTCFYLSCEFFYPVKLYLLLKINLEINKKIL